MIFGENSTGMSRICRSDSAISLVAECQLSSRLFNAAGSRRFAIKTAKTFDSEKNGEKMTEPYFFRYGVETDGPSTCLHFQNIWHLNRARDRWFLSSDSRKFVTKGSKRKGERKGWRLVPPPCRKFATLTRRRCGKTHKKTSPKNRRRPKWRMELEESGWQITKFVLLFASFFSGHESSRLLNPKEKISLWYYNIKIRMLLLFYEICDKCSIHPIFQITQRVKIWKNHLWWRTKLLYGFIAN